MTELYRDIDAEGALRLVLALHGPFRVYDLCIDPACEKDHVEIEAGEFTCTPPIGWACEYCCLDPFDTLIDCRAHSGDHHGVTPEDRCETVQLVLGATHDCA